MCRLGQEQLFCPVKRLDPIVSLGGGTVVCKDVLERTVVGGNPVKIIGNFEDFVLKREL